MEAATGSRSVTLNLETPNIMQPCLEAEVACPASESPTSRIRYWKVPPQRHRQCQRTSAATFGRALPPHRPLPPHPADVIVAGPQPTRPHLRSYAGLPCPAHAAAPGSPPRLPTSRPPLCFRHGLHKPGFACLVQPAASNTVSAAPWALETLTCSRRAMGGSRQSWHRFSPQVGARGLLRYLG